MGKLSKNNRTRVITKQIELTSTLLSTFPLDLSHHDVVFTCIGTDRSTGDSLGPLVGTILIQKGYQNVIGTIKNPLHAMNFQQKIKRIPNDKKIIAIDAALGLRKDVGTYKVFQGPVKPGQCEGTNHDLPEIGDFSILGVVNISGYKEHQVLQTTRLAKVIDMANQIAHSLMEIFPLENQKKESL